MNTPSTQTLREWIDSMPEDADHMHNLVIYGGQMYRIIVEQIDADKMDYSVRDFILKTNLDK